MLALPLDPDTATSITVPPVPDGAALATTTWPDEAAFIAGDPRRRTSAEVDLGATWRRPGSEDAWRLAWLAETGELYLCRLAGYPAHCTDVTVLAVVATEHDLDALIEGWRDHRADPAGVTWLASRLTPSPRPAD